MLPPEIEESLQEFDRSLNTTIPLRHHWEYIDARRFNCKIQTEKDKAIQNFRQVVDKKDGEEKREFAEKFHYEVNKLIIAHQKKNEDFMDQAQSLLKKRREDLCADFKSSFEVKLLRNQDFDFEEAEELLETGKELGKSYFEYHSNYGNPCSYNDERMQQEKLLTQDLNTIEKKLLKQRRRHQKSVLDGEGRKLLEEKAHPPLKKCVEVLCADLKSTTETKLRIAPDMDLKSLKYIIENGKELAKTYFEYHTNFRKGMEDQLKEQELLEQELKLLGKGILGEQRRHLKSISSEEGKSFLDNFKKYVLEMSEKVKADSRQWSITKRKLKEKVQEIHKYMVEHGSSVLSHENNREIYTELLKLEAGENMSAEDFIEWTEGLSKEVKHDIECEMEAPEMHFLEFDSDEDAPQVEGSSEIEYRQEKIKEEVLEMEDESHVLETYHDMDIDVKLELDGLFLQKSCLKPGDFILKRSHDLNLDDKDAGGSVGNDIRLPPGTMAPPENVSVENFRKVLHSLLSLRHFSEFYEDEKIRETTDLEKENFLKMLMEANPSHSPDLLKEGLQNVIDELVKKNKDHESRSQSFFKKQVDSICETFVMSSIAKLEINPEMDLPCVVEMLERGKVVGMKYFEDNWNLGNVGLHEKQKDDLKEKLIGLGKEMLENQRLHLENVEAGKVFENVKAIILTSESIVLANTDMADSTDEVASESRSRAQTELSSLLASPQSHSLKNEPHETAFVVTEVDVTPESSNVDECCLSQSNVSNGTEEESVIMPTFTPRKCTSTNAGDTVLLEVSEARKEVPVLKNDKVINTGVILQRVVKRVNPDNQEVSKEVVCPPVSKKSKRMTPECKPSIGNNLNVPDKNGFTPFLLAIREGQDVSCIKEMLDNGADVNTSSNERKDNAVHQVICSLIKGKRKVEGALAVLNLLATRGFKLINDGNCVGFTPLFLAMQYKSLNEDLLDWFFDNGANFNAVERDWKNSVLFQAISQQQSADVLRRILYFRGNSKHVNKQKWNVLHKAACSANDSALKLFIDQFDINGTTMHKLTPLHLLFVKNDLDYQECLKVLLQKGADFYAEDRNGLVPLVRWIKRNGNNCYQTLYKMKDTLPITPDIASSAFTAIVEEMERLQEFLPRRENPGLNEFILFLFKNKNGSLLLKDEDRWKTYDWQKLKDIIITPKFIKELNRGNTGSRIQWIKANVRIRANMLGSLQFYSKTYMMIFSIETVLRCLLAGSNYEGFVETCKCLKTFCGPVSRKD